MLRENKSGADVVEEPCRLRSDDIGLFPAGTCLAKTDIGMGVSSSIKVTS